MNDRVRSGLWELKSEEKEYIKSLKRRVYVVESGEDSEGGIIHGVFSSLRKALREIERMGCDGWEMKKERDGSLHYHDKGCSWASISMYEVG